VELFSEAFNEAMAQASADGYDHIHADPQYVHAAVETSVVDIIRKLENTQTMRYEDFDVTL